MPEKGFRHRRIPQFRHVFDLTHFDPFDSVFEVTNGDSNSIGKELVTHIETVLDDIFDPLPKNLSTHNTVKILFETLAGFDEYTAQHSQENGEVGEILARACGIQDKKRLLNLRRAALLHDIGKIGILSVLHQSVQPGRRLEFRILHAHFTRYILQKFPSLSEVESIASAIHVKQKGKSYPPDLNWDTIPYEAKILSVADALHSITHERPGDGAKSRTEALDILRRYGYDEGIVDVLEQILPQIPERLIPDIQ